MKNLLQITSAGEDLLGTVDDGTNRLFINDTEIASSQWTGSGSYTGSFSGHTITIAKIADTSGNVAIRKTGTYTYELYDQKVTEYLPLTGGTLTGQVLQNYQGADSIKIEHGVSGTDASVRVKRTDTGVGIMFGVGTGGINHGVYSDKLRKWLIYGDASSVHVNGTAENVSGTVDVAHGGTGQTSIAAARNAFGLGNTTGAVPVANGGTGASTAANARSNLGATHNVADSFADTKASTNCFFINMSAADTIDNVSLPRYAKGIQASNSSNDATMLVIDTIGTLYSAFRNNGTWTRAKKYGSTSLWNGTLGSSAVTITNAMKYDRLIFIAQIGSNPYFYSPLVVPCFIITTSDQGYEVADDASYVSFNLKYSGNNVIMTRRGGTNSSCTVLRVVGVN